MTLLADFLLGIASLRHHCTEAEAAGTEGPATILTAILQET
jgi:hypothetical protein